MKLFHKTRHNKGFTLLEAIVTLFVLSVCTSGISMLFLSVTKGNTGSKNLTSALILGETKLEELKANGFGSNPVNGTESNIDEKGTAGGIFTRTWTIAPWQGSANMEHIEVNVSWQNRSVSFDTILSKSQD